MSRLRARAIQRAVGQDRDRVIAKFKRPLLPDPAYNSRLATMMLNKLMVSGKKATAERLLYGAFQKIQEKTGKPPIEVFNNAIRNATPLVEVKARRVGGATYQVPVEVRSERGTSMALRWLVDAARKRPGKSMIDKLSNEILDASNEAGNAIRKREETHRMAEANKAFAHYRY
ncbi:30S ribosomal protein S7 [Candidatus Cyanaurora vandensis]|uniref:30S ribosomal protein S7 n=1 Tax=Candidatus Cyanaurora vandensis TaxID=2714958 RepID=UPI002580A267|nr:30S ribosomal protein S7 [Candidatus Cyanaurora vandensis]